MSNSLLTTVRARRKLAPYVIAAPCSRFIESGGQYKMKAIEILERYWEQFKGLLVYIGFCIDHPVQTLVCHDFWLWNVYVAFGLGLLLAVMIGKKLLKEQMEFRRNRNRLEARKIVADEETIKQARWKGEDAADVELSQEELAAKMREAINARANSTAPGRAKVNGII